MKTDNYKAWFGKFGEEAALEYLKGIGYEWLASNYRTSAGEIDLIMKDGNILVFIEVKSRKGKQLLEIETTIKPEKVKRILKSAEIYIEKSSVPFDEMRVDAVFIEKLGNDIQVKHCKSFY